MYLCSKVLVCICTPCVVVGMGKPTFAQQHETWPKRLGEKNILIVIID